MMDQTIKEDQLMCMTERRSIFCFNKGFCWTSKSLNILTKMFNNYNLMDSRMEFVHEESFETHYDLQDDMKEDG